MSMNNIQRVIQNIVIVVAVTFVAWLVMVCIWNYDPYNYTDYEEELGIDALRERIRFGKERMLYKENVNEEIYERYNDISFVYSGSEYLRAEITGTEYAFKNGISVGSTREEVENAFEEKPKIKDLPEDEFGFCEGSEWIVFLFGADDVAEKIMIYLGP